MAHFRDSSIFGSIMFSIVGGILYLIGSGDWLWMAILAFVTNFLLVFIFGR